MVFSWLTNQRRKKLLAEPMPPAWLEILARNVRHYQHLSPRRQKRIRQLTQILVAEKKWEGGSGYSVTDEMKVTIAGQAAILAIGLAEPYYFDEVQSIIIYPTAYVHPGNYFRGLGGIINGPYSVLGESWYRGPIILSWRDVLAAGHDDAGGHNLVLHEFAHYIDALDGEIDGTPPLVGRERQRTWFQVTEAEYRRLVGKARRNEVSLLDHYGATNRAEFFAVATECFFEQPHAMWREHREFYRVLRDFYRQHPARWLPDAKVPNAHRAANPAPREAAKRQRQERLAVLRSRKPGALFALAVQYVNESQFALAAATATRVIALHSDDGEAYVLRASSRIQRERYAAALADANAALQYDPDDEEAYSARGAALVGLGEFKAAKRDLDYAITLDGDDAELRYYRGRAWLGLGDPARAAADFARSITLRPLVAEVHYHSGLAQRALGHEDEAKADFAKATQLDPKFRRDTMR